MNNGQTGSVWVGSAAASLAEAFDALTSRLQAGEAIGLEEVRRLYPAHADELARLLPALAALGQLSGSGEPVAAAPAGDNEEAPGTLGDFRIIREVGRGGMGVVYEAEQVSLRRRVALKVLPFAATLDPRQLQRFHNEARAAAGLHHSNIVPVYGVGQERGVHYYAMQFIDGQTLAALIRQLRRMAAAKAAPAGEVTVPHVPGAGADDADAGAETPLAAALSTGRAGRGREYYRAVARWGAQAAEALDYAHQVGVVHRDVKPANLMVENRGQLWVTDFGLARIQTEASLTATGDLVGTLRYMSPEQALAKRVPIDHRTDVYSLGATLYELLTLRPLFGGTDRQELLRQIAFEEPVPLRRLNAGVPAELEIIVLKALEKNPQERYAMAQDLADDLRRWMDDRPIQARRPPLLRRLLKWARRHRPLVGAAAALLLASALLGGINLLWLQQQQAAAERTVAILAKETEVLESQGHWDEAAQFAKRAEDRLPAGASPQLRERVRRLRNEVRWVAELDEVRLDAAGGLAGEVDKAFQDVFVRHGLDLLTLDPEEAARRIRASAAQARLVEALDTWGFLRRRFPSGSLAEAAKVRAVANRADDDPWRQRLRTAAAGEGRAALRRLAEEKEALAQPAASLLLLGTALQAAGDQVTAEQVLRRAQGRHPEDFWLDLELAELLCDTSPGPSPRRGEGIGFYRAALALRPWTWALLNGLGNALREQGDLAGAEETYRRALPLAPTSDKSYDGLGKVLVGQGRLAEAEEAYSMAAQLEGGGDAPRPTRLKFHHPSAEWFRSQQEKDAYRVDSGYKESDFPRNLGLARCKVGLTLQEQGRFAEAVSALRRGHELGSKDPHWDYPSARWVREAERLAGIEPRLPQLLKGEAQPADADEAFALAVYCQMHRQLYAAAARWYSQAFGAQPALANDPATGYRYAAACAAALAGCGRGKDADGLSDEGRARLRRQALDWLRADLEAWHRLLDEDPVRAGPDAKGELEHWLGDRDLAGVRGDEALARLPEAERPDWHKLWLEVRARWKEARVGWMEAYRRAAKAGGFEVTFGPLQPRQE